MLSFSRKTFLALNLVILKKRATNSCVTNETWELGREVQSSFPHGIKSLWMTVLGKNLLESITTSDGFQIATHTQPQDLLLKWKYGLVDLKCSRTKNGGGDSYRELLNIMGGIYFGVTSCREGSVGKKGQNVVSATFSFLYCYNLTFFRKAETKFSSWKIPGSKATANVQKWLCFTCKIKARQGLRWVFLQYPQFVAAVRSAMRKL